MCMYSDIFVLLHISISQLVPMETRPPQDARNRTLVVYERSNWRLFSIAWWSFVNEWDDWALYKWVRYCTTGFYSWTHFVLVKHNIDILLHACSTRVRFLHSWADSTHGHRVTHSYVEFVTYAFLKFVKMTYMDESPDDHGGRVTHSYL